MNIDPANDQVEETDQHLARLVKNTIDADENSIMKAGIEIAVQLTDSVIGYVHLMNDDQQTIELVTWSQKTFEYCSAVYDRHYDLDKAGVWADTVRLRQPVIHNDYQSLPEKQGYPEGHARVVRHLGIPVIENDKVRLLIGVGNKTDEYTDREADALQSVANTMWSLVTNRRVIEGLNSRIAVLDQAREFMSYVTWNWDSENEMLSWHGDFSKLVPEHEAPSSLEEFESMLGPDCKTALRGLFNPNTADTAPVVLNIDILTREGEPLPFKLVGERRPWPRGHGFLVHGILQDVSLYDALENAQYAASQAEKASSAKTRFLANVSHELRTPIHGMLGMAQLLLTEQVTQQERLKYGESILESGELLMSLVEDLLDVSKIEEGKLTLKEGTLEPAKILKRKWEDFRSIAKAKGLELTTEWLGPPGRAYAGDEYRLRQMLANLINNAIKFTKEGSITVTGKEVFEDGKFVSLRFTVADTGVGIPIQKTNELFEPFSQIRESSSFQHKGSGLGLSIVKSLAKLMGGEVGVESTLGEGSEFWINIPTTPIAEPFCRKNEYRFKQDFGEYQGKILLAEDDPVSQMVTRLLLEKLGITVEVVSNGQEAVQRIKEEAAALDLVFMDLQMPVMDGYEATEQIRDWEKTQDSKPLPIIALTAQAFDDDQVKCLRAGMDGRLVKPVMLPQLAETLSEWLPCSD